LANALFHTEQRSAGVKTSHHPSSGHSSHPSDRFKKKRKYEKNYQARKEASPFFLLSFLSSFLPPFLLFGQTGVGVGDLVGLVGVKPDLALSALEHRSRQALWIKDGRNM
jgi:hypothetical protein